MAARMNGVRRCLLAVACGAALTLGCGRIPLDPIAGTADGGAGSAASGFATATAFCREFEAHSVQAETRCFGAPPADDVAAAIAEICDPLDGLVASGRIDYDATAAAACLA